MSAARVLAELLQPVEAETPYGGRVVSYEPLGLAWLAIRTARRRDRIEAAGARAVESLTAEVRVDPRLAEGRLLRFGGGDWEIVAIGAPGERPGRCELTVERTR